MSHSISRILHNCNIRRDETKLDGHVFCDYRNYILPNGTEWLLLIGKFLYKSSFNAYLDLKIV